MAEDGRLDLWDAQTCWRGALWSLELCLGWQCACVWRCPLTLPVVAEGAGQSGHCVWHLHGEGVGQARGPANLRHPAQLHSRPLPGLPAHLAEGPTGLPAGCHQVSVMERPTGREETPQRGVGSAGLWACDYSSLTSQGLSPVPSPFQLHHPPQILGEQGA